MSNLATTIRPVRVRVANASATRQRFYAQAVLCLLGLLPVYNLIIYQQFPWLTAANPTIVGIRASDLCLLAWLIVVGPSLLWDHWESLRRDPYLVLSAALFAWSLGRDVSLGAEGIVEYAPAGLLFLVVYGAASRCNAAALPFGRAAKWGISFYLAFGLIQIATGAVVDGRVQSVFGNPNFLAFYMLHMLVLLEWRGPTVTGHWVWQALAVIGIVVSKTRSVLLGVVVLLTFRLRGAWKYAFVSAVAVAVYVFPYVMRLERDNVAVLNGRVSMWRQVLASADEFDWIFGSGKDAISQAEILPMYRDGAVVGYYQPQSEYLQLWAEHGLVGLLLWAGAIAAYLRALWRFRADRIVGIVICYVFVMMVLQAVECDIFQNLAVAAVLGLGMARANALRAGAASVRARKPAGRATSAAAKGDR